MYASDNKRRYSDLSMMATLDPLSGSVMTISSRHFNLWMDFVECYGSQGCSRKLFKVVRQIRLELPKDWPSLHWRICQCFG